MTLYPQCPKPNVHGRCGCNGYCAECGFRPHTIVHGTPGDGTPDYVHEFVSVRDLQQQATGGN